MVLNTTMLRCLGISHIITGTMLICFGVVDGLVGLIPGFSQIFMGVWSGIWIVMTGIVALKASPRGCTCTFFVFSSIMSALFGFGLCTVYGLVVSHYLDPVARLFFFYVPLHSVQMVTAMIILALGGTVIVIGTMAWCVACRAGTPRAPQAQQQVVYTANPQAAQYRIIQGPDGGPLAVPVQNSIQASASGAQGVQPQMILAPTAPSEAMATGYQHQQGEIFPLYGDGRYMTEQKGQE